MRVLVTGDRNWDDPDAIFAALDELVPDFAQATLVHGDARGADRRGAKALGLAGRSGALTRGPTNARRTSGSSTHRRSALVMERRRSRSRFAFPVEAPDVR